jgi:hypothetical protein
MDGYGNSIPLSAHSVRIGIDDDDGEPYLGNIDMAILYDRALSPSEMALHYREPFCMVGASWDWALYGAVAAPPTGGQVIMIQMTAIPAFLILLIVLGFSMVRKRNVE